MGQYRSYETNQLFFQVIDPEEVKSGNALVAVIDEFIEKHLVVSRFEAKLRNEEVGAPAVDPRIMLKVLFYAFATGVRSYRRIENRLSWDQNFLVLSSRQSFDHSTISRFIKQYKEEILHFFSIMLYVLRSEGYVNLDFIAIDGTKIRASAGKDFTGTIEDFQRRKGKISKKIEELLDGMGRYLPDDPDPDFERKKKKIAKLQRHQEKINEFLNRVKNGSEVVGKDEKINLTDRDARMMKDKDSFYMGFNGQLAVDGKYDLVVGSDLFNSAPDQPNLRPMIETVRKQTGDELTNSDIALDAGYYSAANLAYCKEEGLNVYIPEGQCEDGTKKFKQKSGISAQDCRPLNIEGKPQLICPGGQLMDGGLKYRADRNVHFYTFAANKQKCIGCELMEKCYEKAKFKRFEMSQTSFDAYPVILEMKAKVSSELGRKKRAERFATNEHVNADIKETMNLRRFYHRGKEKIKTIWCLTSIAYNFRRLASLKAA